MHVRALGLLAVLILTLLTSQPSYACDRCESVEGMSVEDGSVGYALQVAYNARRAGWPEPLVRMITAIAMAESRGRPTAQGDREIAKGNWGNSIGLTQVRSMVDQTGTGGPRDRERLFDPVENLRAALELYRGENFKYGDKTWYEPEGFEAWSTYSDGSYKDWLDEADAAIAGLRMLEGR